MSCFCSYLDSVVPGSGQTESDSSSRSLSSPFTQSKRKRRERQKEVEHEKVDLHPTVSDYDIEIQDGSTKKQQKHGKSKVGK